MHFNQILIWFCNRKSVIRFFIIQVILTFIFAFILLQLMIACIGKLNAERQGLLPNGKKLEDEENNEYRLEIARNYLKASMKFKISQPSSSNIAIGIIAAYRKKYFYLTQTSGYLFHELNDTQIPILVCFVEERGDEEIDELQKIGIDIQFLYKNRSFPQLPGGTSNQRMAKESNDYWNCLERVGKLGNSQYVLLLEDDALVVPGFVGKLESLMYQLSNNERRQQIDYVKLFHPWNLRKIPSFIQIALMSIIVSFIPVFLIQKLRLNSMCYLNAILISIMLTVLCIKTNKQLFADFRYALTGSGYLVYPETCCTPAVLFRSSSIPEIVKQFSQITARIGFAKDHILDESDFLGRMSDRNFVTHIGYYSSIRQSFVFGK